NPVSGYSTSVTLSLGAGSPAGATLQGTTTALIDPDNGVATFPNVTIPQQGRGYVLTASAGLVRASAAPLNVGGVTASQLGVAFLTAPITAGAPFTLRVAAQDALGRTDTTYTGSVTVALGPASPAGATLGGNLTVNAQAGVATFTLTLSQPGKDF